MKRLAYVLVGILLGALICAPYADAAARRSVASRLASLEKRVKKLERPLTTNTPIVQHWDDPMTGRDIIPPKRTTLGQMILAPDSYLNAEMNSFALAFEQDITRGDTTFHYMHEKIDGKRWPGGPNGD